MRSFRWLFIVGCFVFNPQIHAQDQNDSEELSIGQQIILKIDSFVQKSFKSETEQRLRDIAEQFESREKKSEFDQFLKPKLPEPTESDKRANLYRRIFYKSQKLVKQLDDAKQILNQQSWDDLKILNGTTINPHFHLLSKVKHSKTLLGEGMLSVMLVSPTSDVEELKRRQEIVKILRKNRELRTKLIAKLEEFARLEVNTLSLWSPRDPLYNEAYNVQLEQMLYWRLGPFKGLNNSEFGLALAKRLTDISAVTPKVMMGAGLSMLAASGAASAKGATTAAAGVGAYGVLLASEGALLHLFVPLEKIIQSLYLNLKNRMAGVAAFIKLGRDIVELIRRSELAMAMKPELEKLKLLTVDGNLDEDIKRILTYASSSDFTSDSYYKDNGVATLLTYKVFKDKKDQFYDALVDFGRVDAFVSIASLMSESENSNNQYSYVKFQADENLPFIKAQSFWNPFLEAKNAVTNDAILDSEQGPQNLIITGPNAGGKSTFIVGLMLNVVLAQTFGIAPAKDMTMTPFSRLSTYIHPSDDIAAGKSLYMAEVTRAYEHIQDISKLENNEFSFSIMDEIFSGTNPKEGEAGAYSVAEYVGQFKNSLNIIATHFPLLTKLESNQPKGNFANFKVIVNKNAQGKLEYPFKVVPGISNQTIAIDILEEQGFDVKMLEKAKDILAHPENYY